MLNKFDLTWHALTITAIELLFAASVCAGPVSDANTEPSQMPQSVQRSFDVARKSSTFAIPRFKRISYSYSNEVLIPGVPKQPKPTQTRVEIIASGELLEVKDASSSPSKLEYTAMLGGLIRVKEPASVSRFFPSKCTESEISNLQIKIPPELQIGSRLELHYELTPLPTSECAPTKPIHEQCEATKEFEATTLFRTLTGRAIYLVCNVSNRLVEGRILYRIYLEDLGLILNSLDISYQTGQHIHYTSFDVEH
jgi:hypothetical protein